MAGDGSTRKASMGRLTRRRFLGLSAAGAAVAGSLPRRVGAQTPRQGGIVKQAWASSPRTLDPALNPPPCAPPNLFLDVPETSPFCRWIEELANRGVVTGCGGGNYCPTANVTREQMSVFLAVTFGLVLYGL